MIDKRPFAYKNIRPDIPVLKKIMNDSFLFYEELMSLTSSYKKEWNFSNQSGWMQKISKKGKALCYLIPLEKSYLISLTLRENERAVLVKVKELKKLHRNLNDGIPYKEGIAVKIQVNDVDSNRLSSLLISNIMKLRE